MSSRVKLIHQCRNQRYMKALLDFEHTGSIEHTFIH